MSSQTKSAAANRAGRNDESTSPARPPLAGVGPDILQEVQVSLETHLGCAELSVQELLALKPGSVVALDLRLNEPVELRLRGAVVARGEIVAVGDNFGIRIVEIGQAK